MFGLVSCLVFRAVRDAVPHDPVAQERIVGAVLMVFGIGDVGRVALMTSELAKHATGHAVGFITFAVFRP